MRLSRSHRHLTSEQMCAQRCQQGRICHCSVLTDDSVEWRLIVCQHVYRGSKEQHQCHSTLFLKGLLWYHSVLSTCIGSIFRVSVQTFEFQSVFESHSPAFDFTFFHHCPYLLYHPLMLLWKEKRLMLTLLNL